MLRIGDRRGRCRGEVSAEVSALAGTRSRQSSFLRPGRSRRRHGAAHRLGQFLDEGQARARPRPHPGAGRSRPGRSAPRCGAGLRAGCRRPCRTLRSRTPALPPAWRGARRCRRAGCGGSRCGAGWRAPARAALRRPQASGRLGGNVRDHLNTARAPGQGRQRLHHAPHNAATSVGLHSNASPPASARDRVNRSSIRPCNRSTSPCMTSRFARNCVGRRVVPVIDARFERPRAPWRPACAARARRSRRACAAASSSAGHPVALGLQVVQRPFKLVGHRVEVALQLRDLVVAPPRPNAPRNRPPRSAAAARARFSSRRVVPRAMKYETRAGRRQHDEQRDGAQHGKHADRSAEP